MKEEMRIVGFGGLALTLSEGNEVARNYTELSENVENAALLARYSYEDVSTDVLIDIEPDYFRLYVNQKLAFEQTASTISVYDGDMVIEETLLFRHATNGLIVQLELDNEGISISVEHIDHTIEKPESPLEQALQELAVN